MEKIYLSSSLKSLNKELFIYQVKLITWHLKTTENLLKKFKNLESIIRLDSNSTSDLSHIKLVKTYSLLKKYKLHNHVEII